MSRATNPRSTEKKKSPFGALLVLVIVLAVLGSAGLIATHIPDTMELERKMDAAAATMTPESITSLAESIGALPRAANAAEAGKLVNEMIQVTIADAVANSDYRTLELLSKTMADKESWKPYATEENRKSLSDGWIEILKRLEAEQKQLNELRTVARRLNSVSTPLPVDVEFLADFKLPASLSAAEEEMIAAAYSGAIVLRAQLLADSILARSAAPDAIVAGTMEPCKECGEKGSLPCRNCTGNPGKCSLCNGVGTVKATRLVGKNFEQVEQPCQRCNGTGECTVCKGAGKRECAFCKGKGKWVSSAQAIRSMKAKLHSLVESVDQQEAEFKRLQSEATR